MNSINSFIATVENDTDIVVLVRHVSAVHDQPPKDHSHVPVSLSTRDAVHDLKSRGETPLITMFPEGQE